MFDSLVEYHPRLMDRQGVLSLCNESSILSRGTSPFSSVEEQRASNAKDTSSNLVGDTKEDYLYRVQARLLSVAHLPVWGSLPQSSASGYKSTAD